MEQKIVVYALDVEDARGYKIIELPGGRVPSAILVGKILQEGLRIPTETGQVAYPAHMIAKVELIYEQGTEG